MPSSTQGANAPTFRSMQVALLGQEDLPLLAVAEVVAHPPGWAAVTFIGRQTVECPVDFALREVRDAPLDDEGIVDFINQWGLVYPLGGPGQIPDTFFRSRGSMDMVRDLDAPERQNRVSLGLSRTYLLVMKAMGDFFIGRNRDDVTMVRDAWSNREFPSSLVESSVERSEEMAAEVLNAALAVYTPRVHFGDPRPVIGPSVFSVAMLQIFGLLNSGWSVRTCKNDRCGRPFTRHRGRSRYGQGQHSQGVLYCSKPCGKAYLEKQRRARLKADRT